METRWVIFSGPQQIRGPGTRYIAKDGSVTKYRHEAANFFTYEVTKEWADGQGIEITDMVYIGQEEFNKTDLS